MATSGNLTDLSLEIQASAPRPFPQWHVQTQHGVCPTMESAKYRSRTFFTELGEKITYLTKQNNIYAYPIARVSSYLNLPKRITQKRTAIQLSTEFLLLEINKIEKQGGGGGGKNQVIFLLQFFFFFSYSRVLEERLNQFIMRNTRTSLKV